MTSVRFLAGAALVGVCSAIAAGCGNDVPTNAVAKVGDTTITKKEFQRWLDNAAKGQQQGGTAVVPDPPNYTKCVAALQKQPVPKGQSKPSADSLKKQCKTQYDQLKADVMQFLIQAQWVTQEAEKQDVKVSEAEVKKSFEDQKKQAFPKEADYKKFLASSGMTEADILYRVRLDQLQTKLTAKVTEDKKKVSNEDVSEYYDKNKKRFAQPERRDLNVVLTKTKAKADEAKAALESGDSFKVVAKKYSIDEASKAQGGKLPDVSKGQQEKALDSAVFVAKKGQVRGPVKTQFGYYVFQVTKVKKASQQSLKQATETIRNLLRSQREQKALDSFIKDFRSDYKDETNCAKGYQVAECKNAPKSKTDTGAASGGAPGGAQQVPQGAAPQGAAPQGAAPQGAAPQGATPTPAPAPTPTP
jgi:foldase protein PrsA